MPPNTISKPVLRPPGKDISGEPRCRQTARRIHNEQQRLMETMQQHGVLWLRPSRRRLERRAQHRRHRLSHTDR